MSDRPFIGDVEYLVSTSPYLQLSKPPGAERFLRRCISQAEECFTPLADYPDVLVEPLEFFYTCLRILGALDVPFIETLVGECNWRGYVWAAWLTILEPSEEFLPALGSVNGRMPYNDWLGQCAVATVRAQSTCAHKPILDLGTRCRELLRGVKRPVTPLRREPTHVQVAQMNRKRELVRTTYAGGGAEAARAVLRGTLLQYYTEDYATWAARRRGPSKDAEPVSWPTGLSDNEASGTD
jgi:hypothetical protein